MVKDVILNLFQDLTGFRNKFGMTMFLISCFLFLTTPVFATHLPKPTNYVNDFAGVLSEGERSDLNSKLYNYEQQTQNQIAVAIIKNLNGEDITDFTVKAFEEWQVGKKGSDNGLLLLISIEDRKLRIEVGYGLEPYLTDSQAGEIIRGVISPEFKDQNYYQGIDKGLSAIEAELADQDPHNDQVSAHKKVVSSVGKFVLGTLGSFGFLLFLPVVYIFSFMARTKSFWFGGVFGGLIGVFIGWILVSTLVGLIWAGILGLVGLLLDWLLSRNYQSRKDSGRSTDWWSTGGGFFGGSSSGGFGGFGGGSSGGGGASGDW